MAPMVDKIDIFDVAYKSSVFDLPPYASTSYLYILPRSLPKIRPLIQSAAMANLFLQLTCTIEKKIRDKF